MKKLFTLLLLLMGLGAIAQPFGNEWIDYSKTYYKFKIGSNGLVRIPQSTLAAAGLGGVPAEQFQLFRNGQEVPIYVTNGTGVMGGSDYIEFWGQMNDGVPDKPLYRSPNYQHTTQWSLETDTSVYFLTVNPTGNAFHYANTANNVSGSPLSPEPYFMYTAGSYFRNIINPGLAQIVGEYIYSSSYDVGEFWSTSTIGPGSPFSDNKANLNVYAGGPDASIKFGMAGTADNPRTVQVSVNGTVVGDTTMNGLNDLLTTRPVPLSLIAAGTATTNFINNSTVGTDRMVVSFYELTYPRQFNFGGKPTFSFQLAARAAGYLLNITNVAASSATPVLYDLTNGLRYTGIVSGGTVSFALNGSAATMQLVLVNEDPATIRTVSSLTTKTFVNFTNTANQGNYLIISNPLLYTGSSGNNPVMDYKNYRSSGVGGAYNAQVFDINELVDQFAFGIKKHPLSIQNFLRYARARFAAKPQYVLLMGHGLMYTDYYTYSEIQHIPLADQLDLVPTFGSPGSDNKLSADNGADATPVTPIGRLSVVSGKEIETYLTKVKEYEQVQATAPNTVDGRLWMKNVLHLTGVSEPYLGTIICNYMGYYQSLIADTLVGANVYTLCDGNASTVSQVPSGFISTLFSTGFSMLNYFGHSSNQVLTYDLDNPLVYNNQGKYPVFYLNGCDAGDFFIYEATRMSQTNTISENYVLAPERGSIACVAATSFGIVNYLNILLDEMYQDIDGPDYGKSIGILEKDALNQLMAAVPGDFFARQHAEQMTIHGDPALHFNQSALPDYDIETPQLLISPTFVSVASSSFSVKAKFYNLGKAVKDSITVLVTRKYPNGTSTVLLQKKIRGIAYADSVSLSVPVVATRDKGQNYITVTVNSDNAVPEITMANNTATVPVYVYDNSAEPAYPYDYAIINTPTSKLYASTADPFFPNSQYVMELDTSTLFNSSLKISKTVTSAGGLLEFDPGITFMDSVVYYWRVSKVPASSSESYTWNGASFVYIDPANSSTGENQSHFYQHTQSTLTGLVADSVARQIRFDKLLNELSIKCGVFPDGANQAQDISVLFNGDNTNTESVCGTNEVIFTVIDKNTFHPWYNAPTGSPGRYGSLSPCGSSREWQFMYNVGDPANRLGAVNLMDAIPDGDYVVVYNCAYTNPANNTYAAAWEVDTATLGSGNSLYHRLKNAGFTNLDSFNRPRAFIFLYQKNSAGNLAPRSIFGNLTTDKITMQASIHTPDSVGLMESPSLGPAKKWKNLHWRGASLESPSTDSILVQVLGVDTLGNVSGPLMTLGTASQDVDISGISAVQYPWLRLKLITRDTLNGTPYQLKYWRLNYDPVPEGALAANLFSQVMDTVALGQTLNFGIAFKNISPTPFDSLAVKLVVTDKSNTPHNIQLPKMKPLVSGDTVKFVYPIPTNGMSGLNQLYLAFNPNYAQPEQYLFNNFVYKNFFVSGESRIPQLDVTFDNVHILDQDIVSARPHIQIRLKSQSQYILLTDTSLMNVQVKYPDGSLHKYGFNNDTLRFTPATSGSNNTATVDFYPNFTQQIDPNGDVYELIVSGKDQLGNQAGLTPYRVDFKIISKPMISNMLNYPNPFTTSTAFVFTITGSEVPQNIKIQILTITGKVVREITKEELGPLHIGRNITEFKWNGTDMYGQRLANGVYLYHVVTNLNGKSLTRYKSAGDDTDKYFNNGYGKMYLMK
ncbi:MAG TPA: C25 family cysteine peptidase [Puia sp.]|uniref:putative type IX secretion system sortase PorU2 n=1 Tax=Puia sp. TaxID=2045100 RepID=UPI002C8D9D5D|nr:C25 family cysteine peptidase [Puia sp.]HVU94955.1 C25 family cysteine peptidase [Puia sp.]